jgi:DNA-binding NarL/FixJ family response regulator
VGAARQVVLVVDDDPGFCAFARSQLERAGFAVLEAGDADEALAAAEAWPPHLVLLDVRLPRVSGYELFRELRDRFGERLPIIFVSGERVDPYDRVAGLLLGADDYLVKPFDPDELIARVRCSLRGRSNRVTAASEVPADEVIAELTSREREVLALLATGYSSAQVAHELVISPRTVGTHVQHILAKLGVSNRTQAVALAHRAGLAAPDVVAHSVDGAAEGGSELSAASDSEAELLSLSLPSRPVVGQV